VLKVEKKKCLDAQTHAPLLALLPFPSLLHWRIPLPNWGQPFPPFPSSSLLFPIGVGAQSTLRGARHFCPKIYAWKINKTPEFYMIFAQKYNKIPEFYMIFVEKYFFLNCGGQVPPPRPRLLRLCPSLPIPSSFPSPLEVGPFK